MKYYLYIDESGVLHPNSKSDHFIFAGILVSEEDKHRLAMNYSNSLIQVKRSKGLSKNTEMKASKMKNDSKRFLLSNLRRNCDQIFIVTNLRNLRQEVFGTTVNINRQKNYMLTKMVEQLIISGKLRNCDSLELNIDNQNIAYNAMDNLESYLHITFNIDNIRYLDFYDYYDVDYIDFTVKYKDSRHENLVQAADLIANTKFREYELEGANMFRHLQKDAITLVLPLGRG